MANADTIRNKLVDLQPGECRVIADRVVRKPRHGDLFNISGKMLRDLDGAVAELCATI